MRDGFARTVTLAGRDGLGRVQYHDSDQFGFWSYHMFTTRMSDDPRLGVVDARCKVHGVANLFVAGSSVFPSGGCGNQTFPLIVLAARLADDLVDGFQRRAFECVMAGLRGSVVRLSDTVVDESLVVSRIASAQAREC